MKLMIERICIGIGKRCCQTFTNLIQQSAIMILGNFGSLLKYLKETLYTLSLKFSIVGPFTGASRMSLLITGLAKRHQRLQNCWPQLWIASTTSKMVLLDLEAGG